jgi:hypothetical protein
MRKFANAPLVFHAVQLRALGVYQDTFNDHNKYTSAAAASAVLTFMPCLCAASIQPLGGHWAK